MSSLQFIVTAEVEFVSGKFAPREEIAEQIVGEIEGADPGSLSADEGEYETVDWTVEEYEPPKPPTRRQRDSAVEALRAGGHAAMADWIEKNVPIRPERRRR